MKTIVREKLKNILWEGQIHARPYTTNGLSHRRKTKTVVALRGKELSVSLCLLQDDTTPECIPGSVVTDDPLEAYRLLQLVSAMPVLNSQTVTHCLAALKTITENPDRIEILTIADKIGIERFQRIAAEVPADLIDSILWLQSQNVLVNLDSVKRAILDGHIDATVASQIM